MARVVVTNRIPDEAVDLLRADHEVTGWHRAERIPRDACLDLVRGADAVVTLITEKVDDAFLDAAGPGLRVVANVAVGYDNVDVAACRSRGIVVCNTPKVLTEATADVAFGLILATTRRFGEGERIVRSGRPWSWGISFLLGRGLQGKTLGIVGAGQIGIALARRAKAFGMNVLYTSRSPMTADATEELGARQVELDELVRTADVISLHCPYVPAGRDGSTHHLFGAVQFAAMKPTAYLVNTARGPIVDETALAEALRTGQIAGAGLDVYENEPAVHPELLTLENVVLLPHIGSATVETRAAMATLAAQNVLAVLAGHDPITDVSR